LSAHNTIGSETTETSAASANLESLESGIELARTALRRRDPVAAEPFAFVIRDLRAAWERTERRLDDLTIPGKDRLGGFAPVLATAARDLATLADRMRQRAGELAAAGPRRTRYVVSPAQANGWRLTLESATRATKHFGSKREAVMYGRSFVRAKQPSELLVCRADGTVQTTYRYE
jgi:hypothetical protein